MLGLVSIMFLEDTPSVFSSIVVLQGYIRGFLERTKIKKRISATKIQVWWKSTSTFIELLRVRYSVQNESICIMRQIISKYTSFYKKIQYFVKKILGVFTCPITLHVIETVPVIIGDGHLYDWLTFRNYVMYQKDDIILSPVTRQILDNALITKIKTNSAVEYISPLYLRKLFDNVSILHTYIEKFDN